MIKGKDKKLREAQIFFVTFLFFVCVLGHSDHILKIFWVFFTKVWLKKKKFPQEKKEVS